MPKQPKNFPLDRSGQLFSYLCEKFKLANDKQLSDKTGLPRPVISKIRTGKQPVTNSSLVHIHETTGVAIKRMRELIAEKPAVTMEQEPK